MESRRVVTKKIFLVMMLCVVVSSLFSTNVIAKGEEVNQNCFAEGYANVTSSLNVRKKPSTKSKVLDKLYPGDVVKIVGKKNDFYKVKLKIGKKWTVGYVAKKYVKIPKKVKKGYKLISAAVITARSSSQNRNYNMSLACKKLNGLSLKPEEKFEWYGKNGVGPANKENGFKEAPVIINKKVEMGYGGGVCQVSTALYNCIYKLKIKPDELHHHSLKSSYVPEGMDATVSYPSKNFRFTNTKKYTIKFQAFAKGGKVTILAYKKR